MDVIQERMDRIRKILVKTLDFRSDNQSSFDNFKQVLVLITVTPVLGVLIMISFFSVKQTSFADAVLLLVCRPDEAEAIVGDLVEELAKVRLRHSACYSAFWFYWTLASIVIRKSPAAVAGLAAVATALWRRS